MLVGAVMGASLNALAHAGHLSPLWPQRAATVGGEIGDVFLRLLQMVTIPLIVASLVSAVQGLGDLRRLEQLGGRTLMLYVLSTLAAITTALVWVNLLRPGIGAELGLSATGPGPQALAHESPGGVGTLLWQQLKGMLPTNIVQALAQGKMLAIIFVSLATGMLLAQLGERVKAVSDVFAALFTLTTHATLLIVRLAPVGVFGFMLDVTAAKGLGVFVGLGHYMLTVSAGLIVHAAVVLPLAMWWLTRRSPWQHAKAMLPALLTAFSTASSGGTLPLTLSCLEERAGVDARVASFVAPLGATINMDGTALYEAVTVLFIAQAYGGDLSLAQQLVVAGTTLLASIGAAGIPHAGTVMMVIVLQAVHLPTEAVGMVLAVDRVLDMGRTAVNVWSDSVVAAVVDRSMPTQSPNAATMPLPPSAPDGSGIAAG